LAADCIIHENGGAEGLTAVKEQIKTPEGMVRRAQLEPLRGGPKRAGQGLHYLLAYYSGRTTIQGTLSGNQTHGVLLVAGREHLVPILSRMHCGDEPLSIYYLAHMMCKSHQQFSRGLGGGIMQRWRKSTITSAWNAWKTLEAERRTPW
jgi:hypothetical protein